MKRRTFLIGTGSTAIGGSALLGSGAFTRVESQRRVKIQVARDPDAYLGLDSCPESSNASYTGIDESGHLFVEMSPDNPNLEDPDRGTGINSDSFTWFDDVFQVCNNGKQDVVLWIESEDADDLAAPPSEYEDDLPRVQFYVDGERISASDQATAVEGGYFVLLPVGECVCVGIRTMSKGLTEDDQLVDGDEVVIHANADLVGNDNNIA